MRPESGGPWVALLWVLLLLSSASAQPTPQPDAGTAPEADPESEPGSETESETTAEAEPEGEPGTESEAEPEVEAATATGTEPGTEAQSESEPEAEAATATAIGTEAQSESGPAPEPGPEPASESVAASESGPEAATGAETASDPGLIPDPDETDLWVGVGVNFGVLNLPSLGIGAQLLGHVDPGSFWPIEFGVVYWAENTAGPNYEERDLHINPLIPFDYPPGGSEARFNAMQVVAATCPLGRGLPSGEVQLCAGGFGGLISATSTGFSEPEDSSGLLLGLDLYARFQFHLVGPIGITYSAGASLPFVRDSFGYTDSLGAYRELHRSGPIVGRFDVMLTFDPE